MSTDEAYPAGLPARMNSPTLPRLVALEHRNLLSTILFLDLVGYSARSVDDQAILKKQLNDAVTLAIGNVAPDSWLAVDTGDGAAVCFLGDPEEPLRAALMLRDLLGRLDGSALAVRIGLHMGPIRIVSDINHRINVVGDGINTAQRVMNFAQPGQVLVSRAYYDVITPIADTTAGLFRDVGKWVDKHGREHGLYAVLDASHRVMEPTPAYGCAVPEAGNAPWLEASALDDVVALLARRIGPMAAMLMTRALVTCRDIDALVDTLASHVDDPAQREAFGLAATRLLVPPAAGSVKPPGALPPP